MAQTRWMLDLLLLLVPDHSEEPDSTMNISLQTLKEEATMLSEKLLSFSSYITRSEVSLMLVCSWTLVTAVCIQFVLVILHWSRHWILFSSMCFLENIWFGLQVVQLDPGGEDVHGSGWNWARKRDECLQKAAGQVIQLPQSFVLVLIFFFFL